MPVGGAILGSAVVGAGANAYASSKAAKSSQSAKDQTLQAQREALATQQANTAVARDRGDKSINQLYDRLNTGVAATASAPKAGAPNWQAYAAAYPDVAAAANDPNSGLQGSTPEERLADHYARFGKPEGRSLPTYTPQQVASAQTTDVPLTQAAMVPNFTRQPDMTAPAAYTPQSYTRPDYGQSLDVSLGAFEASPESLVADNAFRTLADGSNAQFSATGALQSGAAAKALADLSARNKVNYYSQFANRVSNQFNTDRSRFDTNFNFDTGLKADENRLGAQLARSDYQYGQGRADNLFNVDRGYATDLALGNRDYETRRYDTTTNNLFNLANLGQGAAARTDAAVQSGLNTTTNALFSNAANQGNAAIAGANTLNNLLGTGVNALAYYNAKKTPATTRTGVYGPTV